MILGKKVKTHDGHTTYINVNAIRRPSRRYLDETGKTTVELIG